MYVLVTYNNEEDQMKKKMNALEWSRHYRAMFRHSRAANSIVYDQVANNKTY